MLKIPKDKHANIALGLKFIKDAILLNIYICHSDDNNDMNMDVFEHCRSRKNDGRILSETQRYPRQVPILH